MRTVRAAVALVLVLAMLAPLAPSPLVVRAADANLARFPPSGWSVSLAGVGGSGYDDGDETTFAEFLSAGGENGAAVGYTFTRAGGAAFTVRSIRVLWGLRESPPYSPPNLERLRARCMEGSPIVWEDATGWSGEATYDTGRVDLTTPCTFDASTVGITVAFIGSLCCNRFVRVHEIELYAEVADPQRRSDAGSAAAYAFGAGLSGHQSVGDPVNVGTGSLTLHADDLALPGRVLPLAFTRWYNSADTASGPLGAGWTHSYHWTLADNTSTVTVRRGDGRQDVFTRNPDGSYAAPPGVFDTLVKNPDATYALTLTSQVAYELSSAGRLVRIREPAGNQITLAYTGADLTSVTDTVGRVVNLSYAGGRLTQLQDPLGRKVTYAYDGAGRLVTVTDKIGNTAGQIPTAHQWRYAYDGATRHITTITDPDGRVRLTSSYDAEGRVSQQRDGLNQLTTFAYSSGQTTLTDPRGHASTYTFDSRMRVLSQTDTVGANTYTISYAYDAAGDCTSVTDRSGKTTDFTYDGRGNVLSKTDPPPAVGAPRPVTSFTYDLRNDLTQVTDPLGSLTTLTYDGTTNVLLSVSRQIDASTSAVTKYEYGDAANPGLPTKVIAPRGNVTGTPDYAFATTLAYDGQGNLVSRTDPDGARTTFAYDAAGRLLSFVDPDGNAVGGLPAQHTWTVAYDANDRETARTDPLGNVLRYGHDASGLRTDVTDRNGNITAYSYDANGRLSMVLQKPDPIGPVTYTTQVSRDANGNAVRITQGNGVLTDYAFDALDRLTGVTTHPTPTTNLVTSYALDGNGQPVSRTTGDGVTVTYSYDGLSRLTSVSGPGLSIAYAYDDAGRRSSMTDAGGTTTYLYDRLGRVTAVAAPAGTLGYAYDRDGDRTSLTYPGGQSVGYAYSPGGRMSSVTDWANRISTYSYTAAGLVSRLAYPGGLVASYGYDRAQRLTDLAYTATGGLVTLAGQHFTLDAEGNRTALEESALVQTAPPTLAVDRFTLSYDGLLRLTALNGTLFSGLTSSETFSYDAATNLSARTGPAASYAIDGSNRATGDGTRGFVWDGADRLVQRGADTFTYDPLGRMTGSTVAAVPSPVTRTYAYDGDGLLRSRTEGASTTSYLWDASVAPAPLLQAGTERVVQGLGPLYLVGATGSGRVLTLVRDALGSVRAEVTDAGVIAKAFRYAAYGDVVQPNANVPTLLGFAGELRDPSGLIYLRARWYDPGTGRFTTKDPLRGTSTSPASLNLYTYVRGRPSILGDASGLSPDARPSGLVLNQGPPLVPSEFTEGLQSALAFSVLGHQVSVQFALVRTPAGEFGALFTPGYGRTTAAIGGAAQFGGFISNAQSLRQLCCWFGQAGGSARIARFGPAADVALGSADGAVIWVGTFGLSGALNVPAEALAGTPDKYEVHGILTYTWSEKW